MAAFTYTALRSIARLSFDVFQANDITVSLNAFTSLTTVLSGLKSGDWILVSGVPDKTNDGWHEVSTNSLSTSISVTSTLNVQASGNVVSIVGYVRGQGSSYSFDLSLQSDDRKRVPTKQVSTSLSGKTETLTHRREEFYLLKTQYLDPIQYLQVIEFLDSCESDEYFSFDRIGTVSNPMSSKPARLTSKGYTENRIANFYREISFELVLL